MHLCNSLVLINRNILPWVFYSCCAYFMHTLSQAKDCSWGKGDISGSCNSGGAGQGHWLGSFG